MTSINKLTETAATTFKGKVSNIAEKTEIKSTRRKEDLPADTIELNKSTKTDELRKQIDKEIQDIDEKISELPKDSPVRKNLAAKKKNLQEFRIKLSKNTNIEELKFQQSEIKNACDMVDTELADIKTILKDISEESPVAQALQKKYTNLMDFKTQLTEEYQKITENLRRHGVED